MQFGVKSKNVLISNKLQDATIIVEDEIIKDILSYNSSLNCEINDFGNLIVMPGLVDTHVHINEPGRTDWEGFETATKSAAAGGITMLVDMPLNSSPVTTNVNALQKKIESTKNKLYVDCGFYGGLVSDNTDDLEPLIKNGVLGLKAFMINSGIAEFSEVNENELRKALGVLSHVAHVPLLVHAEIDCNYNRPANYDKCSFISFLATRPRKWENKAIEILIKLCREFKYPVHIVHLSSSDSIELIRDAKQEGLPITVETCPHYLYFSSEEIPYGDTRFKCTPPIREKENKEKLWEAIKDKTIDFIVSDHSPCNPELKNLEEGDFESAWGGLSSLQHSLSIVWTEAKKRNFTIADISTLMSENTARFIGLGSRKGKIQKGYDADLVVFDPDKKYIVKESNIFHKHKISPYQDKELLGTVETTYVRGRKIFDKEKIVSEPSGKIVLRNTM